MGKWILGLLLVVGVVAYAGTNDLPTETSAVIQRAHVNKFKTALSGDLVPRNSSGTVGSNSASIGSSTYKWVRAFFSSGYWAVGDIKSHHSFNGLADPGEGWMLCDGRQITEAAYNTEHGSAHWATYVGSSPILNKYLPNLTGKYLVGVSATTQSGSSAITAVGNASHQINLAHTHTGPSHNHQWLDVSGVNTSDQSYNSGGSSLVPSMVSHASGTPTHFTMSSAVGVSTSNGSGVDLYTTNNGTGSTSSAGSATQSIQPESIEVQYYMRVAE